MANVFIYADDDAATRSYFDITENNGYEIEALLPLIGDDRQSGALRLLYPDGKCFFWGTQENRDSLAAWDMMDKYDLILGRRSDTIIFACHVLMKLKNPFLASRLWNTNADHAFSLLCFTTKPDFGDTVIEPQMSAYLDMNCRGRACLNPEKRDNILRDYGSFEVFVRYGLGLDFPPNFRHSE